jgi:CheY-like chemotaxis protein
MPDTDPILLVLEDNEDDLQLLLLAMRRKRLRADIRHHPTGHSGWTALLAMKSSGRLPTLIVSDLDMPEMTGYDVLQRLRADPVLKGIPFLILTGSLVPEDRYYCEAADHYFVKPRQDAEWDIVTNLVGRYLSRSGTAAVAAAPPAAGPLVLHIEDNHDDRELFAHAFAASGIPGILRQVVSSEDALGYLHAHAATRDDALPDLIVLDLGLPGRGGQDFLKRLRQQERFLAIPVIILTDSTDFADIQACRDLLVIDYMLKPRTPHQVNEFIDSFRRWLFGAMANPLPKAP